jgi:hypothetical protein
MLPTEETEVFGGKSIPVPLSSPQKQQGIALH